MTNTLAPRARRREVAEDSLRVGDYDYADAFQIQLPETDTRSPEQLFRQAVDSRWLMLRWVPLAHRWVLRLRLGPASSPNHIFGWRIVASEPDVIRVEAEGPLIRGVIVGRRRPPSTAVMTTYVFYVRRKPARVVWALVGPLHRRIAPYLLERAAGRR